MNLPRCRVERLGQRGRARLAAARGRVQPHGRTCMPAVAGAGGAANATPKPNHNTSTNLMSGIAAHLIAVKLQFK